MPQSPTHKPSPTDSLITLKTQLEQALTEASTKASHLREQLSHVNALLLNQLLQGNGVVPQLVQGAAEVPVIETISLASAPSLAASPAAEAPASTTPKPKASPRKPKATAAPAPALGKRSTRPLLPAYRGLTRVEAIAQLLQTTPGQDVSTDQVSEGLFGKLSAAEHKAERKSLNTQMYQGVVRKLWQKGTKTGTFLASASAPSKSTESTTTAPVTKAKAPKTTTAQRKSLTLLPAYAELTKRGAIAQVLTAASGEVLHQDTIIQTLYGDLSTEELKEERVRIKTALLIGAKDDTWQKASAPSSYFIKATAGAKPKSSGRKSKAQTTKAEAETAIAPIEAPTLETAPAAAKKRDSLTVLPAFEGMTKLDAIAKVLGQNLGEVLHQDMIIQMLYGDLSLEDLKKERVRMDTSLRNGVKSKKWKKAPVPASYVMEATAAGAKPKRPGRKPEPTKEPKPEPVADTGDAIAPATAKASATKAKPKPARKPAAKTQTPAKAKAPAKARATRKKPA